MNEKEKEAIELIKYIKEHNSLIGFKNTERRDLAETVLNLIEKQQEEIETLKRDFEIVDHECSRLEKADIRKDKIIQDAIEYIEDTFELEEEKCITDLYNILTKK